MAAIVSREKQMVDHKMMTGADQAASASAPDGIIARIFPP
jgi:hypothetical protein